MSDQTEDPRPCWIDIIEPEDASPELAAMCQRVGTVHNKIHNLSLQPGHIRDLKYDAVRRETNPGC